jgi:hypothetical protein
LSQATVVVKLETLGKIVKKSPEAYILVHFEDCIVDSWPIWFIFEESTLQSWLGEEVCYIVRHCVNFRYNKAVLFCFSMQILYLI